MQVKSNKMNINDLFLTSTFNRVKVNSFLVRDKRIFRNGSKRIFDYIRKTETSLNEYRIYLNNLNFHDRIFEYIWGPKFNEYSNIFGAENQK